MMGPQISDNSMHVDSLNLLEHKGLLLEVICSRKKEINLSPDEQTGPRVREKSSRIISPA
jgi:hypothetical protein